jgi:hypothetical protein
MLALRGKSGLFVAGIWVLLALGPARAHHSASAEFDATKRVMITGSVTRIDWANPHTFFYIDVTDHEGKVSNWSWELPSPNQLMRAGWTRNSMKIGDVITVEGIHARDGSNHGMANVVTMASTGQRLFAGEGPEQ